MKNKLGIIVIAILLAGCSGGKISYYEKGNLNTRIFQNHLTPGEKVSGEHFEVKRNKDGNIVTAKHLGIKHDLVEKSSYNYNRQGQVTRYQVTDYFFQGPPRISRTWLYKGKRISEKEEKWFTRSRLLEKRMTTHYDGHEQPFLEETWGLGNKIASSTEYYYDFKHRLDKSRRNFFLPDGELRDYWLTIYNDQTQITTEEHYLPDNSLIAFYRYSYHPTYDFRETEEVLEENKDVFIFRKYNEYGYLMLEEEKSRELALKKRLVYEYDQNQKPLRINHYGPSGHLAKTTKYKKLRTLGEFRASL